MFCANCGKERGEGKYCTNCGHEATNQSEGDYKNIKRKRLFSFLIILATIILVWAWWFRLRGMETKCPVINERDGQKSYSVLCLNSERDSRFQSLLMFDGTVIISSVFLLYLINKKFQ